MNFTQNEERRDQTMHESKPVFHLLSGIHSQGISQVECFSAGTTKNRVSSSAWEKARPTDRAAE